MNVQDSAVVAPDFRHPQRGKDAKTVQRAVRPINFDYQVGGWIAAQIDFVLAAHQRFALNPVAFVGLQAALELPPLECHGAETRHVPAKLLDQSRNQEKKQTLEAF